MHEKQVTISNDEFGPEYRIHVYDPATGMEGFLVIDNLALGPGKGGIRMTTSVTLDEISRLARTMTWKNALAGIPFGGAKAGMRLPKDPKDKKAHVQAFARALMPFMPKKYIAGPDVNSGEQEMRWFVEATGNWRTATGKPANLCMDAFGNPGERCGIPHEFGSTGFGVAHATAVAARLSGIALSGATVSIHGFGNVATFAWRHLTEMGANVIMLADSRTVIYSKTGFNPKTVEQFIREKKPLKEFPGVKKLKPEEFWSIPVDIMIPSSVTDVIHDGNKYKIKTKIIVEAGNIPMQEYIEEEFHRKGILVVPDFVANAGGVISSYAEYRGYNPKRMFDLVERRIVASTETVLKRALKTGRPPREVGMEIARARVLAKMKKHASKNSPI